MIDRIVQSYENLVNNNQIDRKKIIGLSIGSHGITNFRDGIIITSPHFPSWRENLPFRDLLSEKLPDNIPITIDNQIRFQVFAEQAKGLGKGKKNIIVMEGGEGLVAGIIVKDAIKRGVHYLAGEIGHMVINPKGEEICACGVKGCFEAMIYVDRVLKMARNKNRENKESLIFRNKSPNKISIYDIFNASNKGDKLARELMDDVIGWVAIGISNMVLMYDPELIVIQGIYSKAGDYFIQNLREKINTVSLPRIKKEGNYSDVKLNQ